MLDLKPARIGASWYVGNLHKWVCAPKGAAFLHVRPDCQDEIQPAVISHGHNSPRVGFLAWQDRFDWAGTFDSTAWFSIRNAIEVVGGLVPGGWSEVRERNRARVLDARRMLCEMLGLAAPCPETMIGSMATLPLPGRFQGVSDTNRIAPEQTRLFEEFGIEIPFVKVGEHRYFRISAHLHNSADEYEYLGRALVGL
jgi:isopenicillin-N epimerase